MNFFQLSSGEQLNNNGSFEMGGGDMEPIPANTQVKAFAEEAKWDEHEGLRHVSIKWIVIDGEYKNRKIFQKIRVFDTDTKKKDKAIQMLAAIDTNSGGGLQRIGQEPTDMDLQANLCNKPMALKVMVWKIADEQTGEVKQGNWVGAVAPLNRAPAQQAPAQQMQAAPANKPQF